MMPLEKRKQLRLLILVFQNQRRKTLFLQQKTSIDFEDSMDQKKILFNILARLIHQYVAFTYTEMMLRNAPRKRSCSRFVRTVLKI